MKLDDLTRVNELSAELVQLQAAKERWAAVDRGMMISYQTATSLPQFVINQPELNIIINEMISRRLAGLRMLGVVVEGSDGQG